MLPAIFEKLKFRRRWHKDGKYQHFEWDSLDDYMADLQDAKAADPKFHQFISRIGGGANWFGCSGFPAFEKNLMYGWPELRTELERLLEGMELAVPRFPSQTQIRRRKRLRSDDGDTLEQERVWDGDLDHAWERPTRVLRTVPNTKRITLYFELGAHSGISNAQAMWRAALCMLLVKSLTQAGRTFEIWCGSSTGGAFSDGPDVLRVAWCVKPTQEPVVMDKLCAMVSVGMLRTCGFMAYNMSPWQPLSGLGRPIDSGLPHGLEERSKNGEVVLRIGHCFSRSDVLNVYEKSWSEIEARIGAAA